MKRIFIFVAVLSSCGKPTQKPSSPEPLKLSDAYAKAALLSVLAIEGDVSATEDRNGQEVVTGTTQSKIDEADAEARTKQEESMTILLRQLYKLKLDDNGLRKVEDEDVDAEIKYHRLFPNTSNTKYDIRKRAAQNDHYDTEMSNREAACFEPLKQALRDRLWITDPKPCIQWFSEWNLTPVKE